MPDDGRAEMALPLVSAVMTVTLTRRLGVDLAVAVLVLVLVAYGSAGSYTATFNLVGLSVFGGLAVVATLLRHRALPVAVVLAASLVALFPQTGPALAAVAYTTGVRAMAPRRRAVLLAAIAVVPVVVTPVGVWLLDTVLVAQLAWNVALTVVVCGVVPVLVGVLVRQREWLATAERGRAENLERAQSLAGAQARLLERARIATEVHDVLGHRLSLIALHAGGLELATAHGDPEAPEAARLIRSTARQALDELRGVLGLLRSEDISDWPESSEPAGSRTDVAELVAASNAAGVHVELTWDGDDLADADEAVRRAIHRVVREALTNVHKHARSAQVVVRVAHDPELVTVEVRNEATGWGAGEEVGSGLIGLHERVRLLGGAFRAETTDDGGFRVLAEIPLAGPGSPDPLPPAATPPAAASPAPASPVPAPAAAGGLIAVLLAVGLVVAVMLQSFLVSLTSPLVTGGGQPQATLGMSRQEFDRTIGNDPLARIVAEHREPVLPAGARCAYQIANMTESTVVIARYCFVNGRMTQTLTFPVAMAAD
jgi:signal transduction histidine kinase